jgi:hypothetical protein
MDELRRIPPCVLKLCERYFEPEHKNESSLVILNKASRGRTDKILQSFNEDVNHKLVMLIRNHKLDNYPSKIVLKAMNYLLMIKSPNDTHKIIESLSKLPTWNPLGRFLVYFTAKSIPSEKIADKLGRDILEELLEHSVMNVNFLYATTDRPNFLIVKTWFPYEGKNCAKFIGKIRLINTCELLETSEYQQLIGNSTNVTTFNQSKREIINFTEHEVLVIDYFNAQLYPKFSGKYHNCPLKISANIREPYVTDFTLTKGVEISTITTITEKLEMTASLKENRYSEDLITKQSGFYSDLFEK